MNWSVTIWTYSMIASITIPSIAQTKPWEKPEPKNQHLISLGYHTFNEVYVGAEFPKKSFHKVSVQVGYQFAITSSASYYWGPFNMQNPFLTNNSDGIRMRVGYQTRSEGSNHIVIFLEYQKLQSNEFLYSTFSGSSHASADTFTESSQKYGLRFLREKALGKSETVFFTSSIALFYSAITRSYSVTGPVGSPSPSNEVEKLHTWSPQLTVGLKFMLF